MKKKEIIENKKEINVLEMIEDINEYICEELYVEKNQYLIMKKKIYFIIIMEIY